MNFVGIVGSDRSDSYVKKLLDYTGFLMAGEVFVDPVDLYLVPLFNRDLNISDYPGLVEIKNKIEASDGVIIAYDQVNNSISPRLKSLLEWLSFDIHPLTNKPVLLMGVSLDKKASLMAQMHLKEILTAPGLEAFVMPGSDFLMVEAGKLFDDDGRLVDELSQDYLDHCVKRFMKYADLVNQLALDDIKTKYLLTLQAGGYIDLDDPYSDGTSGATDY